VALIGLGCACGGLLGGCAQHITTPLPDLIRPDPAAMKTPAQQKEAIDELTRKRTEEEAKAIKDIQSRR
jgi:hypothetical protein